ncbi:FAD:protein FMN transferase [Companilactobacillus paralimentarius]|uniref:FAD:protein FMN transferase n=1 Tax=Companilactobacillus paralimentarius TaxID=83526 RepID=UPI002853054D|nr:FAD:protein FMN transferase [Companilactobacillus paralimentarius]MDR4932973.1 FAD:protein FMN transferase [Companilactobacillus paralimentarius]
MKNEKYYLKTKTINQMNMNFLIKLATLTTNVTVMELLKVATERIDERLQEIDRQFSAFRYDSLVSKFQRGDQKPLTTSNDFKQIYNSAILSEQMTNGIYRPYFAGKFDPSTIVRSWAIEQVFDETLKPLLKNPEVVGVYLSGDQNIKFATKQDSDFRWEINIPNSEEILTTYYLKNGAISTFENDEFLGNTYKMNQADNHQTTVIRSSLIEDSIWALVGSSSKKEEFMSFIKHYNLTGIVVDKQDNVLNFNLGSIIDNKEISA